MDLSEAERLILNNQISIMTALATLHSDPEISRLLLNAAELVTDLMAKD